MTVGEPIAGELEYDGDTDFFSITGQEGQLYQIDVTLGTLEDFYLTVFDTEDTENSLELIYIYDLENPSLSQILWEAPESGQYYIEVGGYGTGDYTLTVALFDDHGDTGEDATAMTVGTPIAGELEYHGDFDDFRFTAQEGQLYQIDMALGTLEDSLTGVYDPESFEVGLELAYNDDYGESLASRILWEAPESGQYYVVVDGYWRRHLHANHNRPIKLRGRGRSSLPGPRSAARCERSPGSLLVIGLTRLKSIPSPSGGGVRVGVELSNCVTPIVSSMSRLPGVFSTPTPPDGRPPPGPPCGGGTARRRGCRRSCRPPPRPCREGW